MTDLNDLYREQRKNFLTLNTSTIDRDLAFIDDAIGIEVDFEPFRTVGDIDQLLQSACNLAAFVRAYRNRTGGLELPPQI